MQVQEIQKELYYKKLKDSGPKQYENASVVGECYITLRNDSQMHAIWFRPTALTSVLKGQVGTDTRLGKQLMHAKLMDIVTIETLIGEKPYQIIAITADRPRLMLNRDQSKDAKVRKNGMHTTEA